MLPCLSEVTSLHAKDFASANPCGLGQEPDPTDPYPLASSRVCNINPVIQDAMGWE